jgi:uncharacterized metal-binding protein YceD (DUF177 family)
LALPAFPLHDNDCKTLEQTEALAMSEEIKSALSDSAEKQSPFGVLEQLKN